MIDGNNVFGRITPILGVIDKNAGRIDDDPGAKAISLTGLTILSIDAGNYAVLILDQPDYLHIVDWDSAILRAALSYVDRESCVVKLAVGVGDPTLETSAFQVWKKS